MQLDAKMCFVEHEISVANSKALNPKL